MEHAPVKWGIVSTADINRKVIPGAHASAKIELAAVASRDARHAQTYAAEWGIPRSYGSYEELLDDPEIEAVYISLPNPEEVERAFDVAEQTGRFLSEAFMWRTTSPPRASSAGSPSASGAKRGTARPAPIGCLRRRCVSRET